jgi:hypothetical protein
MRTEDSKTPELRALRALARYETHGGYVWAGITNDGGLLCDSCIRCNYRQVYRATRDQDHSGWAIVAATHSGEWEDDTSEICDQCGTDLNAD